MFLCGAKYFLQCRTSPLAIRAKTKVMQLAEQKHVVYQLGTDYTREEFYLKFGNGSTFPQIILNEDSDNSVKLGGCTDTVAYLKEQKVI